MREATVTAQPAAQSYIIKRPRLTKLLDESEARIILLCAPAGYGKTTLAREWTSARQERVDWYSARQTTADVAAFGADLAELFEQGDRDESTSLVERVRLLFDQNRPLHDLATLLGSSFPSRDSLLVIDDCHHIVESREADS